MKSYNERKKENLDNKENDVYKENKKNIYSKIIIIIIYIFKKTKMIK